MRGGPDATPTLFRETVRYGQETGAVRLPTSVCDAFPPVAFPTWPPTQRAPPPWPADPAA
ncbi:MULTISPECIES: hypothetical protein [Streptomyces]|uniref:hypothetical protein n=1 Tax=Streptomyces TaxID=1883 RepID=UPI000699439F|nr:hypothetical protein [Streptomyces sp. SID7805]MYU52221.1 hypothetical protein [Streptomyces sp. SID7805]